MRSWLRSFHQSEEGHVAVASGALLAAAGVIALGIGAANDTGWLAIAGGIVSGIGILANHVIRHRGIDWDVYHRLEEIEKRK